MAFYPPRFNVWCKVYGADPTTLDYVVRGYSICQVRGSEGKAASQDLLGSVCEILFPRGSDIRSPGVANTGIADLVLVAGYGNMRIGIFGVCDKGAGFANEYRQATGLFYSNTELPLLNTDGLHPVNVDLLPPDGYTPLPIRLPKTTWGNLS